MEALTAAILIIIGGILVGICVHFIPASAVGAMSAATGMATGPSMLSAGAGMAGILSASYSINSGLIIVAISGALGSTLMLMLTILGGNIINGFGTGVAPASGQMASKKSILGATTRDVITHFDQKPYISPGTDGHGMPAQTVVSGIIGALIGGTGGAIVFYSVYMLFSNIISEPYTISGFVGAGIFLINCVIPAYTLVGKTDGMFDPKIRKTPITMLSCFFVNTLIAIIIYTMVIYYG